VKGHQDNNVTTVLARDAWLNIEDDQLARQYMSSSWVLPNILSQEANGAA